MEMLPCLIPYQARVDKACVIFDSIFINTIKGIIELDSVFY